MRACLASQGRTMTIAESSFGGFWKGPDHARRPPLRPHFRSAIRLMSHSPAVSHLLATRRFLPLFGTQLLGAFNHNLFRQTVLLCVDYEHYHTEQAQLWFSAL